MSLLVRALAAFAVAAAGTWFSARTARRIGLMDRPGPRKPHPSPVPLAGGVGVAAGATAGLWGARVGMWPLVALWALVVVGLIDDVRDLRARTRLAAQAVAVAPVVLVAAPSFGIPRPLEAGLALVWVLAVISAVKCFDVADGVAAGAAIAGALALGWLGGWDDPSGSLAAALAGAAGGFVVLNAPPARCFLGESGSTALGFLLAVLGLQAGAGLPPKGALAVVMAATTILAVPILDFVLVHWRRARAGVRRLSDLMASSGTDHLPHRLAAMGLGPRWVAAGCAGSVAMGGMVAHLALGAGLAGSILGAIGVSAGFFALEETLRRRSPAGTGRHGPEDGRALATGPRAAPAAREAAQTGARREGERILVTGGAGFLGSHFIRGWLMARGGPILNLDLLTYAGSLPRIEDLTRSDRYQFVRADVADKAAVRAAFRDFRPELVVHFAAESHVTRSEWDGDRFWRTNALGARVMLEEAEATGVRRFVHVSTDEVYGPILEGAFREEDKLPGARQATSAYAKSKAVADDIAVAFRRRLDVVVVRPTNCFGWWQHPEKAFARWVTRALTGRRVPIWGDGLHLRQWLYADDLAEAIGLVLDARSPEPVYNVGPRHWPEITNLDLATWLLRYLGLPEERLVLTPYDRPRHDRRYAVDPSRMEALGWHPGDAWRQFAETVEWYRRAAPWWTPLLAEAESIYPDAEAS